MIPKIIHYCWFGRGALPEKDKRCIETWKKFCPNFEIREWNEDSFDVGRCTYVREAYALKKWAFVADYARIWALVQCGGIYLDTDMELVRPLDGFLTHNAFAGLVGTPPVHVSAGIIASEAHGEWVSGMLDYYDKDVDHFVSLTGRVCRIEIPHKGLTTRTIERYDMRKEDVFQDLGVIKLYPQRFFYADIDADDNIVMTDDTYAAHRANASWFYPQSGLFTRISRRIGNLAVRAKLTFSRG